MRDLHCCGWCGRAAFGQPNFNQANHWKIVEQAELPPMAMRFSLRRFITPEQGKHYKCYSCLKDKVPCRFNVPTDDFMIRQLIGIHPLLLQSMACIDIGVAVHQKFNRFASGTFKGSGLFATPLVGQMYNMESSPSSQQITDFQRIFQWHLLHNDIIREYRTVPEMSGSHSIMQLTNEAISRIITQPSSRGPVSAVHDDRHRHALMALLDVKPEKCASVPSEVLAGYIEKRESLNSSADSQYVHSTLAGKIAGHPSRETLLFPYIFTMGYGAFKGERKEFRECAKLRMTSFLSPFTLVPAYPLMLFLYQQALKWQGSQKTFCLDEQARTIKRKRPDISDQDLYKQLLKRQLPESVYGSPKYYQTKLADLKALVSAYGLPSFFVTFTADEVRFCLINCTNIDQCQKQKVGICSMTARGV